MRDEGKRCTSAFDQPEKSTCLHSSQSSAPNRYFVLVRGHVRQQGGEARYVTPPAPQSSPLSTHHAAEFVAHTETVNCAAVSRKSGGLFATGADDRVVNVWAVGQPNMLLVGAAFKHECV